MDELVNCDPPGLNELKQVELYTKWRKIVPKEHWESTCPKPRQEILDRVKNEKKVKARKRKQVKDEKLTVKLGKLDLGKI